MGSKLGVIISLLFVAMFTLLGADTMSIQYIYSNLDAKATNVAYVIAKTGVTKATIEYIEREYDVTFTCLKNCAGIVGAPVDFKISVKYKPIIISNEELTLSITRQAIVGYYG